MSWDLNKGSIPILLVLLLLLLLCGIKVWFYAVPFLSRVPGILLPCDLVYVHQLESDVSQVTTTTRRTNKRRRHNKESTGTHHNQSKRSITTHNDHNPNKRTMHVRTTTRTKKVQVYAPQPDQKKYSYAQQS